MTEPFQYSIKPFISVDDHHISASIFVSSVSKVMCVVAPENSTASLLLYEEVVSKRFYIHSKRATDVQIAVNYIPKTRQRLFCKLVGLLYDPHHIDYYQSDSFSTSCTVVYKTPHS